MLAYREKLDALTLGGEGSGNFGHAGRPGEVGGSGGDHATTVHGAGKSVQLPGRYDKTKIPPGTIAVTSKNGYILVTKSPNAPEYLWVNHVRVDDKAQGKGEGKALYTAALKAAQAKGFKGILKGQTFGHGVSSAAERVWSSFERNGMTEKITVTTPAGQYESTVLVRDEPRSLSYRERLVLTLGGPGSGNFGHTGRPGEIGGSGDGDGATDIPAGQKGECFRNAATWVREHGDDYVLVHGKVTNGDGRTFDHAWAESDTEVADPTTGVKLAKDRWYGLVKAEPDAKYTSEQAAINMLRTRNLGPWTPEEVGHRHLRALFDLGGAGSGNFGHAGRPGEVGGSSGDAGTAGTKGLKFRSPTRKEEQAFSLLGAATALVAEKKDGATVLVQKLFSADPSEAVQKRVLGDRDMHEVLGQMVEDLPGDLRASWQHVLPEKDTPEGDTSMRLIVRGDGVSMRRTFTRHADGTLTVHHDTFEVPKAAQGKGLAKAVLADSLHVYRDLRVSKIGTLANLDRGGYAWAKFGFTADKPEMMATMLRERVGGKVLKDLTPTERTSLVALIDEHRSDPKLPWHVAGAATAAGRPIGKELLYDMAWFGTLDLKNTEAVARLEHYVKGH